MSTPLTIARVVVAASLWAAAGMMSLPANAEDEKKKQPPTEFAVLRTKDGVEYLDCRVIRTEPDALVIRHQKGIARLSFFHLSREIREAYQFDPFAAIEHYQNESERQRDLRWRTFWDKQRHEAKEAEKEETKKLIATAVAEWVPVEARVVQKTGEGFLARCKRVTFVKTKKRSKLGFLVDGPPKRKLVDFADGKLIMLRPAAGTGDSLPRTNSTWKGYVYPATDGDQPYFYRGQRLSAPAFQAVERP